VGCTTVQGYLIAPALPLVEFLRMAERETLSAEPRLASQRPVILGA
jgi:hypothetical protein